MTNPNNAVGTNGAFNGRTSVNAFNDIMAAYSKGIVSGWACAPSTGMTVTLGGSGSVRDVAIAEDNAGNKTSINNISGSPISVTIPAAPSTNNRIDLIVAYADNPPIGDGTSTDNPGTVGLIVVSGTAAGTPSAPNDTAIRTAITSDGATGASAYYVVLAQILVGQGVTTIGSGVITAGTAAQSKSAPASNSVNSAAIQSAAITPAKMDFTSFKMPTPDYVAAQDFTTTTYTAPADGWVQVSADLSHQVAGDTTLTLDISLTRGGTTVNNVASSGLYSRTQYEHFYPRLMFPVRQGDVVALSAQNLGSWQVRRFFPIKWN